MTKNFVIYTLPSPNTFLVIPPSHPLLPYLLYLLPYLLLHRYRLPLLVELLRDYLPPIMIQIVFESTILLETTKPMSASNLPRRIMSLLHLSNLRTTINNVFQQLTLFESMMMISSTGRIDTDRIESTVNSDRHIRGDRTLK